MIRVAYPGYPRTTEELATLRAELLNGQRATWAQLDSDEWRRLHVVGAIYRPAKLGMSFEESKIHVVDGSPLPMEFFHVRKVRPCVFKGGSRSSNSKGLTVHHVSAFAFTDTAGPAPAAPAVPAVVAPTVAALSGAASMSWKVAIGVTILAFSLLSRVLTAVQEVNIEQVVDAAVKGISSFFFDKLIDILLGAETGIIVGFCESLWEGCHGWFVWLVRSVLYGYLVVRFGLLVRMWDVLKSKYRAYGGPLLLQPGRL